MADDNAHNDIWEKIKILTAFMSSVLLGIVGIVFTYLYNQRQLEQNKINAASQLEMQRLQLQSNIDQEIARIAIQKVQLQTAQLQAMTQLTPYLASKDMETKRVALSILRSIDSTAEFVPGSNELSVAGGNMVQRSIVSKSRAVYGIWLAALSKLDESKNVVLNLSQPYNKRIKTLVDINNLAHNKNASQAVRDSAMATLAEIKKSPNTPLLGLAFTVAEFKKYVDTLQQKSWAPAFIVLHHTVAPSLAQRPEGFTEPQIISLINFFTETQGWKGAPHLFIDDHKIWVLNPLTSPGVHAPLWNKTSIGIDILGDYDRETITSGRGKVALNNAIAAIAILNKKFNLNSDSLKFHRDDLRFHKTCPGKNIDKASIIAASKQYRN
jgi:hypothetical protein